MFVWFSFRKLEIDVKSNDTRFMVWVERVLKCVSTKYQTHTWAFVTMITNASLYELVYVLYQLCVEQEGYRSKLETWMVEVGDTH